MAETLEELAATVAALKTQVEALIRQLGDGRAAFVEPSFDEGPVDRETQSMDAFRIEAPVLQLRGSDLVINGRHGGLARALTDQGNTLQVNVGADWAEGVVIESDLGVRGTIAADDFTIAGATGTKSLKERVEENRNDIRDLRGLTTDRLGAVEGGSIGSAQLRLSQRLALSEEDQGMALVVGSGDFPSGVTIVGGVQVVGTAHFNDLDVRGKLSVRGDVFGEPGVALPFHTTVNFNQDIFVKRMKPLHSDVEIDGGLLILGKAQIFDSLILGEPVFNPSLRPNDLAGGLLAEGVIRAREVETLGGDIAEHFTIASQTDATPGSVMVIGSDGALIPCDRDHDPRVAGVVAGAGDRETGLLMKPRGQNGVPIGLAGTVYCNCDAGFGAIAPGDLLTTSATPGHARHCPEQGTPPGAVIGKALTALEHGRGQVLMLIGHH